MLGHGSSRATERRLPTWDCSPSNRTSALRLRAVGGFKHEDIYYIDASGRLAVL